jgi:hypothetical protein
MGDLNILTALFDPKQEERKWSRMVTTGQCAHRAG